MKHLDREIDRLKAKILSLSSLVEENVTRAIKAVVEHEIESAKAVAQSDDEVDRLEVEVEEECLKVLALYQPVAIDLRYIIAILKINNDLERIGDLSVNIAYRALELSPQGVSPDVWALVEDMTSRVRQMLSSSLQSMVNLDAQVARNVCAADKEVDQLNKAIYRKLLNLIKADPTHADNLLLVLNTSRNLERIADHVTNIAEDVIYMTQGEIVRHGRALL